MRNQRVKRCQIKNSGIGLVCAGILFAGGFFNVFSAAAEGTVISMAIDAVNNKECAVVGIFHYVDEYDSYLQMSVPISFYVRSDSQEVLNLSNVSQVKILWYGSWSSDKLKECDGHNVKFTGSVSANDDSEVTMLANQLEILDTASSKLQSAVDELNQSAGQPSDASGSTSDDQIEILSPETEVSDEAGIHRYSYFVDDCTWTEAFSKAVASGGYLLRINSREEYEYVLSELVQKGFDKIQFRIGGRRGPDGMDYYWVDEQKQMYGDVLNSPDYWAYDQWMKGEPSYQDGETQEYYMDFYYYSDEERWVWNDVPDDIIAVAPYYSGKIGYIVEYDD